MRIVLVLLFLCVATAFADKLRGDQNQRGQGNGCSLPTGCSATAADCTCTTCSAGYYFTATGTYGGTPTGTCTACSPMCTTCTSATSCDGCTAASGSSQASAGTGGSVCTCPSGKYISGTGTTATCASCPDYCATCTSSTSCQSCSGGATHTGNAVCTCPSGTYGSGSGSSATCTACPGLCPTCTSATACTSCVANAAGSPATCSCNSGYYSSGTSCQSCPALCATCTSSTSCQTCSGGATHTGNAVCTCPAATYNNAGTCSACPDLCTACTSATACSACVAGASGNPATCSCDAANYQSGTGSTATCPACTTYDANCATCSSSTCLTCNAGYHVSGTGCAANAAGTVMSDPIVVGFDGKQFDFKGLPHRVFNMFSIPDLQISSLFISANKPGETYTGAVGIQQGGESFIKFDLDRALFCASENDTICKQVPYPMAAPIKLANGGALTRPSAGRLHLDWPEYSIHLMRVWEHPSAEEDYFYYIDFDLTLNVDTISDQEVHGVLGQTFHHENMTAPDVNPATFIAEDNNVFTSAFPAVSYRYQHAKQSYAVGAGKSVGVYGKSK